MCFAPGEKSQGEEMSATFLDVCGRPCALLIVLAGVGEPGEPEKKHKRQELSGYGPPETWSCSVRFFHEFRMFPVCFLMILARFFGSGPSWVPGGRQEAHPDAK